MSLANIEWQNLADVYGVKVCELRFAMAMIDAEFKGTMTDYEVASIASTDPEYVQSLRQAIFDENIGCQDEKALNPSKSMVVAKTMAMASGWQANALRNIKDRKSKGTWKNAEYHTAKMVNEENKRRIIEQAKQSAGPKNAWLMTAAVVAVPALVLYLLIRKPG